MKALDEVLAMREKAGAPSLSSVGNFTGGAVGSAGKEIAGHLGKSLAVGAGAGIAGALVTGAGVAASALYGAATKARDFREMMGSSFNEDLHAMHQERPRQFNEAYSSLRSVNPAVTQDPMTAGVYMRRMMTYDPSGAGGVILESLNATKEIHKARPSPMAGSFQGAGSSAASGAMGDALKGRRGGPQRRPQHGQEEE